MLSFLVLIGAALGILVGRAVLGRWYNHVTLYSGVWGVVLFLYSLDLIHYYDLILPAWGYIVVAWIEIVLGATIVSLLVRSPQKHATRTSVSTTTRPLAIVILAFTAAAALALAFKWFFLYRQYGGFAAAAIDAAGELYQSRLRGDIDGQIPYVATLTLAASALAGVYAARIGRLSFVSLVPLAVQAVESITAAGRLGVVLAGFLFLSSFVIARSHGSRTAMTNRKIRSRLRVALTMGAAAGVAVGTFILISSTRGLVVDLPGVDPAMHRFSKYVPFLPSVYAGFSASPVVFSEYLKEGGDRVTFGTYTFAPVWRSLAKVGIGKGVAYHGRPYSTPISTNIGSYLLYSYAEFGPAGPIVFPFVLSALVAVFYLWAHANRQISTTVLASHLIAIILFSFAHNIMYLGTWFISVVVSWSTGMWLDRGARLIPRVQATTQPT